MTTEDDFHAALDANPQDWQTRLVFADWLEESGDARAEGYRALGRNMKWPYFSKPSKGAQNCWWASARAYGHDGKAWQLESDWFDLVVGFVSDNCFCPTAGNAKPDLDKSRRELEDAAALAFARLPASRRAELLAVSPPPKPQ